MKNMTPVLLICFRQQIFTADFMDDALDDMVHQNLLITCDLKWRFFSVIFKYGIE